MCPVRFKEKDDIPCLLVDVRSDIDVFFSCLQQLYRCIREIAGIVFDTSDSDACSCLPHVVV